MSEKFGAINDAESFQITTQKLRTFEEWAAALDDVVKIREAVRVGKASNASVGISAEAGSMVIVIRDRPDGPA